MGKVHWLVSSLAVALLLSFKTSFGQAISTNHVVAFPGGGQVPIATGLPEGAGQEYWDAQNTGNPLLDTRQHKNAKLSTNFELWEFARSGDTEFEFARIDRNIIGCLQAIRTKVNQAITINSGYRTWEHNVKIYLARNQQPTKSFHMSGQAADIRATDRSLSGEQIAKTAIDVCGCNIGVGIANTYAHVDVRGVWAIWKYEGNIADAEIRKIRKYHDQRCKP